MLETACLVVILTCVLYLACETVGWSVRGAAWALDWAKGGA